MIVMWTACVQDGHGPGTVTLVETDGWVEVRWDHRQNFLCTVQEYRMGAADAYDLQQLLSSVPELGLVVYIKV